MATITQPVADTAAKTYPSDLFIDRLLDIVSSRTFIGLQGLISTLWLIINLLGLSLWQWGPIPFIVLNGLMALEAAFATPLTLYAGRMREQMYQEIQQTLAQQTAQLTKIQSILDHEKTK